MRFAANNPYICTTFKQNTEMKRTITIAAVALLAGILLTGCCQKCRKSREAATRPIQGTVWHLVEFDGKPVDAPDKYELSFLADGRVAGIGECNRFFGPYQVVNANGGIKIGPRSIHHDGMPRPEHRNGVLPHVRKRTPLSA